MSQTILLLHAFPLSKDMWREQADALTRAGKRVVTHNLPGFGGEDGAITSLGEAAEWIFDRLPPGPINAVGLSMGGYLLLEMLRQASGRFERVVFADTTAQADSEERRAQREEQARRVLFEGVGFLIEEARNYPHPITSERAAQMVAAASPDGVAGALHSMAARPDSRKLLKKLSIPTLVIVGTDDTVTHPDRAREIANLTNGKLIEIPGAGHLSNLDQPQAFNDALLEFFQ